MMKLSSIEIGRSGFSGYRRIGLGELESPRPDVTVICFCEDFGTRWYTSVNTGNLKALKVGTSALELSAMAKTKRRQLAALAAQAELKELAGDNERISSGTKSGPSGAIFQAGDPNVEIRTQRVIFKIPALPPKPPAAADTQQSPDIAKEVLRKRRRKKPAQVDIEPSSERVPADEAKISKGIVQFGKWKRHKKIRDLLPTGGGKAVPSAGGLSNGGQSLPVTKPMENGKLKNGQLHLSVRGPQRPSKKRVKLMTGSRKRAKVQEVIVRSPPAQEESKSSKTQGAKLQEEVVRSPAEKLGKSVKTQGKSSKTEESALDRPASALVTSKRRSRDLFVKDTDRSQLLAMVGDVDSPSSLAHLPAFQKRKRGNAKKNIPPQVPVAVSPKATAVVPHHRTRSRAKISYCEAMALEVLQEIRNVKKNSSQRMENLGKIAEKGRMLARSAGDGGHIFATRDQSEANAQNSENLTSPQEKEQFAHDSSSNEVLPSNLHTSHHTSSQSDPRGGLKSQLHRSFAKQGPFLVRPKPGKAMGKSAAEIIKQDSQLTIMEKRLEAAGGFKNWLLNKGLEQVLPILEEWNLDNLSLMQLTMEGLKSMGLLPVGPRRKLLHAISSLTLPSFPKRSLIRANGR